jgi:hypothetical protein
MTNNVGNLGTDLNELILGYSWLTMVDMCTLDANLGAYSRLFLFFLNFTLDLFLTIALVGNLGEYLRVI